jgi:benzoyl-CoA reductase subunit C
MATLLPVLPPPGTPAPVPEVEISADFREFRSLETIDSMVAFGRKVLDDLTFPTARAWAKSGRGVIGCFPVYTPQELIHSMDLLPVLIQGGGENIDITHADAPLGSFLCSVSKSTLEMALTGRLAPFSGFIFPYICDVSRNLEGIFSRVLPNRPSHMLHLPQNFHSEATLPFLVAEYRRLIAKLHEAGGRAYSASALTESIALFERHRARVAELARLKLEEPWRLTLTEFYVLVRLGNLLPREIHLALLERAIADARQRERKPKDAIRVALVGSFCEQPTLDLLDLLEQVGCYVVDDELQMQHRWYAKIPEGADPLERLARAYVSSPVDIGVRATPTTKGEAILAKVDRARAQGVVFLTAKFCEPALEDVVLYRRALDGRKIPYLHLEFEEKSTSYDQSRLQLETFVESILFD